MQVEISSKSVRAMADRIAAAYPEVTKPLVLEMLSSAFGYKNFDTLSGVLKAEEAAKAAKAAPKVASAFRLYIPMFVCNDYGDGPTWACKKIDENFVSRLLALAEKAKAISEWSHIAVDDEPSDWDEGDEEDQYRMECWSLYVSPTGFWFRGNPRHASYACETRIVRFEELFALIGNKSGSPFYFRIEDYAFCSTTDASELFDTISEHHWQVSESDVAEWAGLHYGLNYDTQAKEKQQEMTVRYFDSTADAAGIEHS